MLNTGRGLSNSVLLFGMADTVGRNDAQPRGGTVAVDVPRSAADVEGYDNADVALDGDGDGEDERHPLNPDATRHDVHATVRVGLVVWLWIAEHWRYATDAVKQGLRALWKACPLPVVASSQQVSPVPSSGPDFEASVMSAVGYGRFKLPIPMPSTTARNRDAVQMTKLESGVDLLAALSGPVRVPVAVVGRLADRIASLIILAADDPRRLTMEAAAAATNDDDSSLIAPRDDQDLQACVTLHATNVPPLTIAAVDLFPGAPLLSLTEQDLATVTAIQYASLLVVPGATVAHVRALRDRVADTVPLHTIYIHDVASTVVSLTDPTVRALLDAFDDLQHCRLDVHNVASSSSSVVTTMASMAPATAAAASSAASMITILRDRNAKESHAFFCRDAGSNGDVICFVRQTLVTMVPSQGDATTVGAHLGAAMTSAYDEVLGGGCNIVFTNDAEDPFRDTGVVSIPHDGGSVTQHFQREAKTRVLWQLSAAPVWPAADVAEEELMEDWDLPDDVLACVLSFQMAGNPESIRAMLDSQLVWSTSGGADDNGLQFEQRNDGVLAERLVVTLRGPRGQVLRARTDLEECHIGSRDVPVRFRVESTSTNSHNASGDCDGDAGGGAPSSANNTVKIQFAPGQVSQSLFH